MLGASAQLAQLGASSSSHVLQRHLTAGPLSSLGRRVWQTNLHDFGCTHLRCNDSRHLSSLRAQSEDAADAVRETLSGVQHML
jgi:hypothetical protein